MFFLIFILHDYSPGTLELVTTFCKAATNPNYHSLFFLLAGTLSVPAAFQSFLLLIQPILPYDHKGNRRYQSNYPKDIPPTYQTQIFKKFCHQRLSSLSLLQFIDFLFLLSGAAKSIGCHAACQNQFQKMTDAVFCSHHEIRADQGQSFIINIHFS